jgi:hypothetical protein
MMSMIGHDGEKRKRGKKKKLLMYVVPMHNRTRDEKERETPQKGGCGRETRL